MDAAVAVRQATIPSIPEMVEAVGALANATVRAAVAAIGTPILAAGYFMAMIAGLVKMFITG